VRRRHRTGSDSAFAGAYRRKQRAGRATAASEADDARGKTEASRSAASVIGAAEPAPEPPPKCLPNPIEWSDAAALRVLDNSDRRQADGVPRAFARGKLWESREAEQADFQQQRRAALEPRDRRDRPAGAERRGSDWRPGGTHKDPRDRFKKKNRPERAWSEKDPATQRDRDKPGYKPPAHGS